MKDLSLEELKSKILANLNYDDSRMSSRYHEVNDYSTNINYFQAIKELEESCQITVDKEGYILPYVDLEKFINPTTEEYVMGVLNRAALIIHDYNVFLNSQNEYGHVSIIRDIDKAISKIKDKKTNKS